MLICLNVFQKCFLLGCKPDSFIKVFYNLITKLFVLLECSFVTCLFRFFEIVVSLFDGINKSFVYPWESFCQGV